MARLSEQKHTSGFFQDAWNSLPAWFRLLPEPPCCLCKTADKLCRSVQCLAYSLCNWQDGGRHMMEVVQSTQAGSWCRQFLTEESQKVIYANFFLPF